MSRDIEFDLREPSARDNVLERVGLLLAILEPHFYLPGPRTEVQFQLMLLRQFDFASRPKARRTDNGLDVWLVLLEHVAPSGVDFDSLCRALQDKIIGDVERLHILRGVDDLQLSILASGFEQLADTEVHQILVLLRGLGSRALQFLAIAQCAGRGSSQVR